MSLRSQAAADVIRNLADEGDPVTITLASGRRWHGTGRVARVDDRVDPETGQMVRMPRTRVTLALSETMPAMAEGDFVSTSDVMGNTIAGVIVSPSFDRTLGMVSFYVELGE